MTTPTSNQAINALAFLMHELRPAWDPPGCVAALRKLTDLPLDQTTIAAVRYATDPTNLTPTHLADLTNRAWDSDWHQPCRQHPHNRAWRTSGECAACYAERVQATSPPPRPKGVPPTEQQRAAARRALGAMRADCPTRANATTGTAASA